MMMLDMKNKVKKYERIFFTKDFWDAVGVKIVETFISVKVWGLLGVVSLASMFLSKGLITGGEWVTTVTTTVSVVLATREIYKIASVRSYSGEVENKTDQTV